MHGIPTDYIDKAVDELVQILGIKENADTQKMLSLVQAGKLQECVQEIAHYLALPIKINLSYIPTGYSATATEGFTSTQVVKTGRDGRGHQGIVAQVYIPQSLPIYGSAGLMGLPIKVKISQDCASQPATFICVMAHELSHIVLHSIMHKEKDNEIYTDLTAMILGFSYITKVGRKSVIETYSGNSTHTQTTTYGYLSDMRFVFAYSKISKLLKERMGMKRSLVERVSQSSQAIDNAKRIASSFHTFLEYVDKHCGQTFSPEDLVSLSAFHHPGYMDGFSSAVRTSQKTCDGILSGVENLIAYTASNLAFMQLSEEKLRLTDDTLAKHCLQTVGDIKTLKKYVGLWFRLRLKLGK